jgi:hypothetical protein
MTTNRMGIHQREAQTPNPGIAKLHKQGREIPDRQ